MQLNRKFDKYIWFLVLFFYNTCIYAELVSAPYYYKYSKKPESVFLLPEIGSFDSGLISFVISIGFLCGLSLILFGVMKYFDYRHDSVNNKLSTGLMFMFFGVGFILTSLMMKFFY